MWELLLTIVLLVLSVAALILYLDGHYWDSVSPDVEPKCVEVPIFEETYKSMLNKDEDA